MDIASYLSIDAESTISDIQQEYRYLNDHFAKRCMEAIIQRERLPFYVEANCEVNKMRDLPELCSSSAERSDIIVYTDSEKKRVVLTGEIKSSTMLMTERKASIGAANLLRLLRSSNSKYQNYNNILFPHYAE